MVRRRFAYPAFAGLISAFVLSLGVAGELPAAAAAPGASVSAGAVRAATPHPDPTSGPRPGPGATSRPKAAPKAEVGPRSANVKPGARPAIAAGKAAQRSGAAASGCGGTLKFGKVYSCPSLSGDRQDVFTVTTTVDNDTLYGTLTQVNTGGDSDSASAAVYDADGNYLCYYFGYPGSCELGAAGKYTVVVALAYGTGTVSYTFSGQSMKRPSSCEWLGNGFFSFASPGRAGSLALGSAGDCYLFDQPVGSVLHMYSPHSTGDVRGGIVDANFQPVCPVQYDTDCVLNTPGPYHVMMYEFYGNAATYTLRMSRLSHSTGCPALRLAGFGDPGSAASTGHLDAQPSVACHKMHATAAGGVVVRIDNDQLIWWTVYDDAGKQVCDKYSDAWSCDLPAAGDYTIVTSNQDWNPITYQIAVVALGRPAGCATVRSLAWDQDAVLLHQTSAVQTNCLQFTGTAGQRVVTYAAPTSYNGVYPVLVTGTGQALCRDYSEETGCVLPADGTYRVVTYLSSWSADAPDETYKVQIRSLTSPSGCPVLTPGAFNAAPAGALGPIRCRTLRIGQAGTYRVRAYDAENYQKYAAVYDLTGHRICDDSSYCEFPAAGDYTMVLDGRVSGSVIDSDFAYATSVLPLQPAGCPVLSQELYRDTFTSPGQYLCRQLPEPTGASIAELVPSDAQYPFTYVMDSAGDYVCDSSYQLWQTSCALTGTAPYFAVLSEPEGVTPGAFAARFPRVDGPPSCPALDGSAVPTGGDDFVVCRSIPADGHGTRETFSWHRASGTGGAYLSIFDANGTRYCGPTGTYEDRTVTCTLPAGPVTLILDAAGSDAAYQITHQPVATS